MKWIKKYESFKVKNITNDDIIDCIKKSGHIYSTIIKNYPNNDENLPLTPLSIDDDGLITVDVDGRQYEIDIKNVEKIEY